MAQTIVLRNNPAYKEGSLLGYDLNSQSRFNPVPITLSRDSEAYVEKNGVLTRVNPEVPRIDSDGALLVEPQRTNEINRSDPNSTGWVNNSVTITSGNTKGALIFFNYESTTTNAFTSPSGTALNFSAVAATTYVVSCFIDLDNTTSDYVAIRATEGAGSDIWVAYLDTSTLVANFTVAGSAVAGSTWVDSIGNNVVRFSMSFTSVGGGSVNARYYLSNDNSSTATVTSNTTGQVISIAGAQFETGSYATSYIKTEGATATRSADVVSQTGLANLLGDAEGSLYVEASVFTTNNQGRISLNNGSTVNRVTIDIFTQFRSITTVASSNVAIISGGSVSPNTFYKVAVRYAVNDFAIYEGGSSISTDTSGSTFSDGTLTNLSFNDGSTGDFYGKIKALAVYDTALDNTELANITTNGI